MYMIPFTSRWHCQRWAAIMEETSEKNIGLKDSNALQFYFGTIIKKKQYELSPSLIEIYSRYTVVKENDIVINGLNLNYDFVTQRIGIVKERGIITSAYLVMRVRSGYEPNYYCYLLKSMDAKKVFHGMGSGIRLTLSYGDLKNIQLPIPPRDEQDQIVRYLDWKVSEINQLINMKKKEIRTVEAIQRSVITELVTHGLSPTAPMKYSGNKWLGNIPAHWNVVPLYAVAKEKSIVGNVDLDLLSVYLEEGVVPFSSRSEKRTNATSTDLSKYQRVDVGDFVLNNQQAWRGSVGVSEYIGIVSPAYIVLSMDTTLCRPYANYLLRSRALINQYVIISKGVGSIQRNIYWSALKRVSILVPPMEEQIMISEHIKSVISQYETVTKKLMKGIEALEEYKTRLVSDVVTGRVDVRGVVIPNYKRTEEIIDDETDVESDDEIADDKED